MADQAETVDAQAAAPAQSAESTPTSAAATATSTPSAPATGRRKIPASAFYSKKRPRLLPATPSSAVALPSTTSATSVSSSSPTPAPHPLTARIAELQRYFRLRPRATTWQDDLRKAAPLWKVFFRQEAAFAFVLHDQRPGRVFSFEEPGLEQGKRRFLVSTYEEFVPRYLALPPAQRHHYELIAEGSPSRLYFDLEFKRAANPGLDGEVLVETLIAHTAQQLQQHFGLAGIGRRHVLDLDSSTPSKFSRHLIFHLPSGAVFRDNSHVGALVRALAVAAGRCEAAPALQRLFVRDDKGGEAFLADLGVYSRNRNMRLYLSAKLGRAQALDVAAANKFPITGANGQALDRGSAAYHRQVLLASLITRVGFSDTLRQLDAHRLDPGHVVGRTATGVPVGGGGGRDGAVGGGTSSRASALSTVTGGYQSSPYPEIDAYILRTAAARGGVQGRIRRWSHFGDSKVLTYDIEGNRFCENIGRPHRSNGIILVVSLASGTYYQKCYDPDCRAVRFKSAEYQLPPELNPFWAAVDEDEDRELDRFLTGADVQSVLDCLDDVAAACEHGLWDEDDEEDEEGEGGGGEGGGGGGGGGGGDDEMDEGGEREEEEEEEDDLLLCEAAAALEADMREKNSSNGS